MPWAIAAILLGLALFGFLRANAIVRETWGIRSTRSAVGVVATVLATLVLVVALRSVLGMLIGAAVLGLGLYGSWRLRRV
jgi:hypothetical protein